MTTVDIKKMIEPDFWKMISEINWGQTYSSATAASNKIKVGYPPYKTNYFKDIAHELASNLANKYCELVTNCKFYTAMLAAFEVVSKGRAEYLEFLDDPVQLKTVLESINTSNPDSLFLFAIPGEDDYYQENIKGLEDYYNE